jgi:hypothetical protein
MMETLVALAFVMQDPDLVVQGRVRKRGGEYELTLIGRGASLPEGATVGLRFHPVERRLAWGDRSIETRVPDEAAAGRSLEIRKGGFTHVERFAAPGEVEVRILLREDAAPVVRKFRLASSPETAGAIERDLAEIERAGEGLLALLEEGEGILDAPCGAGRRGREYRAKVERRAAAWREAMSRSSLSASAEAFSRLVGDVEVAAHAPCSRPLSALSGEPFDLEETSAYLEGIREAMAREARLVIAGEFEAIRAEAGTLARLGDAGRWDRAAAEFRRGLEAFGGIGRFEAEIAELSGRAEEYLQHCASAVVCPGSVGAELDESEERLDAAIRKILAGMIRPQ